MYVHVCAILLCHGGDYGESELNWLWAAAAAVTRTHILVHISGLRLDVR